MIFYYKYKLKNKKIKNIKLNSPPYYESIKRGLKKTFGESLIASYVASNYYEFRLNRVHSLGELQLMGRNISNESYCWDKLKLRYIGSNQLFIRVSSYENKYYALLENVIETSDKKSYILTFDATNDISFIEKEYEFNYEEKKHILEHLEGFSLEATLPKEIMDKILVRCDDSLDFRLYDWYVLSMTHKDDKKSLTKSDINIENKVYNEYREEQDYRHIKDISKVENKNIENFFSIKSLNTKKVDDELINAINSLSKNRDFVAIYNVGQGSCSAICDTKGRAVIYFDFGGDYAKNYEYCLYNRPIIILSHWDRDHWVGAQKNDEVLENKWVVPNQKIGLQAFKIADAISRKGSLYVWETSKVGHLDTDFGSIFKCNGKDHRHNNGIGILYKSKDDEKRYLLPGDNRYRYIDNIFLEKLDGLVASHHGGIYYDRKIDILNSIP